MKPVVIARRYTVFQRRTIVTELVYSLGGFFTDTQLGTFPTTTEEAIEFYDLAAVKLMKFPEISTKGLDNGAKSVQGDVQ